MGRLGMLVWQDMPSMFWEDATPHVIPVAAQQQFEHELARLIEVRPPTCACSHTHYTLADLVLMRETNMQVQLNAHVAMTGAKYASAALTWGSDPWDPR